MTYRLKAEKMINYYGSYDITEILAVRTPIMAVVDKALDVFSLGQWSRLKREFNHDQMFHLGIVVTLNDGKNTRLVIEKLERVSIEPFKNSYIKSNSEVKQVPMNLKKVSLYDLLNNAKRGMGTDRFYGYSGTGNGHDPNSINNCQTFIMALLNYSGLGDPESKQFIQQNLEQLLKKLNKTTHKIAQKVTDTASKLTYFLGLGYCDCDCHKN